MRLSATTASCLPHMSGRGPCSPRVCVARSILSPAPLPVDARIRQGVSQQAYAVRQTVCRAHTPCFCHLPAPCFRPELLHPAAAVWAAGPTSTAASPCAQPALRGQPCGGDSATSVALLARRPRPRRRRRQGPRPAAIACGSRGRSLHHLPAADTAQLYHCALRARNWAPSVALAAWRRPSPAAAGRALGRGQAQPVRARSRPRPQHLEPPGRQRLHDEAC